MYFVPEGQHDSSQVRSAWVAIQKEPVPEGRSKPWSIVPLGPGYFRHNRRHFVPGYYQPVPPGQKPFGPRAPRLKLTHMGARPYHAKRAATSGDYSTFAPSNHTRTPFFSASAVRSRRSFDGSMIVQEEISITSSPPCLSSPVIATGASSLLRRSASWRNTLSSCGSDADLFAVSIGTSTRKRIFLPVFEPDRFLCGSRVT